jgi:branched-chain amino acid transport system permease protein
VGFIQRILLANRGRRYPGLALGMVALALVPAVIDDYGLDLLILCLYYLVLAASWNLVAGYAGQFSLATVAFAAIGAYTTALLGAYFGGPPWAGIIAATVVAGLSGLLLGVMVLKMHSSYLAITTWAFAVTIQIVLTAGYRVTRGYLGLSVRPLLGDLDPTHYYYVFLVMAVGCLAIIAVILNSPIGYFIRAIKDDQLRASTLGIDTTRWKVFIFSVSSAMAGLDGACYAHYTVILSPAMADFSEMGKVLIMVLIGGMGTFWGPVVAVPVVEVLYSYLQGYGQWAIVIYAMVAIVVMRTHRAGLSTLLYGSPGPLGRSVYRAMKQVVTFGRLGEHSSKPEVPVHVDQVPPRKHTE